MKNNFTDLFKDQSRGKFGITREEVEKALENPDKREILNLEQIENRLIGEPISVPFVPTFYLNKEEKGYLLIATRIEGEIRHIDYVLKVFPEFFEENIENLGPIAILKRLASAFGLEIEVGKKSGKVISEALIPFDEASREMVNIKNPKNHSFVNSFYIRPDRKRRKIICALAFCIDTTRYNAWKRGREENYLREAREIIEENKKISDVGKRFNLNELEISLLIIREFLGSESYCKVLKKHQSKPVEDEKYQKIVKSDEIHPLSKNLWSGSPEDYIRVINLGRFLFDLWKKDDSNKLSNKVDELKKCDFPKTYFELKTACYFERKGLKIEFISREKGRKTPDFRIISKEGVCAVECKKQDPVRSFDLENHMTKAASQLKEYYEYNGDSGIIFIELNDIPPNPESIQEQIDTYLEGKEWVNCVVITVEKYVKEGEFVELKTKAHKFKNSYSECDLPSKIREFVSKLDIPKLPSLQERFS